VQEAVFEEQVRIAVDLGKPLFCHEREAHSKFLEVFSPSPPSPPSPEHLESHMMMKIVIRGFPRPGTGSRVTLTTIPLECFKKSF
jgi:Tat protein secretion system quality control protein TatD with DNase activity